MSWLLALGLALLAPAPAGGEVRGPAREHLAAARALAARGRLRDARLELQVARALAPGELQGGEEELLAGGEGGGGGAGAGAEPAPARLRSLLNAAERAYRGSELRRAEAAWREALELQPGEPSARLGLERLSSERYRPDPDQPFDRSVAELYEAALRERRKGRPLEARVKLEEARTLNPQQPQVLAALEQLGAEARLQGAWRRAGQALSEGRLALAEGRDAEAAAAFAAALEARPGWGEAAGELQALRVRRAPDIAAGLEAGQAALARRSWAEAEGCFRAALALDPLEARARGGLERSRAGLEAELRRGRRQAQAERRYQRGLELWQAGDLAGAASCFREVLKLQPGDSQAAAALERLGSGLQAASERARGEAAEMLERGRGLERSGALEQALELYRRAGARDPGLAGAAEAARALEKRIKGM